MMLKSALTSHFVTSHLCLVCVCLLQVCLMSATGFDVTERAYTPADAYKVNTRTVYTIVEERVKWNEGVEACQNMFPNQGGTLAKIESMEAQTIIFDLVTASGDDAWFGLNWQDETTLAWVDISCSNFQPQIFDNFAQDEDVYKFNKLCYSITATDGTWVRSPCQTKRYFVCQHYSSDVSTCGVTVQDRFNEVKVVFHTLPVNQASSSTCTEACLNITGCFMTWPATGSCLIGLADSEGGTYALKQCYGGETRAATSAYYSTNDNSEPESCQPVNTSTIQGQTGSSPLSGGQEIGQCPSVSPVLSVSDMTTTVTSTVISSVTSTVTMSAVSTHVETTVSVSTVTLTPSMTAPDCTSTMTIPVSIAPGACVSTVTMSSSGVPDDCTNTVTLSPSIALDDCTSTVTSVSMEATTVTISPVSVLSGTDTVCPNLTSVSLLCPTPTTVIATTSTQDTTSTVTEVATSILTSCTQTSCDVTASQYGGVVTQTVTNSDCVTSSFGSQIKEIITTTLEKPTTVFATVSDCESSIYGGSIFTITETTTETSSCDISPVVTFTSLDIKTSTPSSQTPSSQTPSSQTPSSLFNPTTSLPPPSADTSMLTSSLVRELLVPRESLSNTRRKKECATDNRTVARMSGWIACCFIGGGIAAIFVTDIPTFCTHMKKRVERLRHS